MGKIKTTEKFIKQMSVLSPDIEILGEYTGVRKKIKCRCKLDGYEWMAIPDRLLFGTGCKKCADRAKTKTHDDFVKELKLINENIVILGKYKNINEKIKCKCNICGSEWETRPNHLLNGHGCNKCISAKVGMLRAKTHEQFLIDLYAINKGIEILSRYKNARTKLKCKCKVDDNEWMATPNDLLSGYGCPKCSESKGERAVADILSKRRVRYIREHKFDDCVHLNKLPFDFYLPDQNICIEYDGVQHFEPCEYFGGAKTFEVIRKRDLIKTNYCKSNGIKLIRIPYTTKHIEKYLSSKLSISI